MATPNRRQVGNVSLAIAVAGAVAAYLGLRSGPFADALWLRIVGAGFEAAVVGGLADWFAVTALFRHPLGLPIPHTAIIPARRAKMIESIVNMVEEEWLSPEVIGQRLTRLSPSDLVVDWLRDPAHVERLGGPVRDLVRGLARTLTEDELVTFVQRALERQLRDLRVDSESGRWLARLVASDSADAVFTTFATSLANLAERPRTAEQLHAWLDRWAQSLRDGGRRIFPFMLQRKFVQKYVEAACHQIAGELREAAAQPDHQLRRVALGGLAGFAQRLADGDPDAIAQAERLRASVLESLETGATVRDVLARFRAQLEEDLADPAGTLSVLIDRKLRESILEVLDDPDRRATFDHWIRTTAEDLLRRHHHQIGLTVRESLEALETGELVAQIEARVGGDLQFIRLNGAVVGGLVGMGLAVARWLAP